MNMRFMLALLMIAITFGTGCRSTRLFGWRGASCGWQPRALFQRPQMPAFQPPAPASCAPACGTPMINEYPVESGIPLEPVNAAGYAPTSFAPDFGSNATQAPMDAVVAGPESLGVPHGS